ncbi:MAG: DNA polymerase III subunit alpha [candidate division WOR-3 bacterium]
MSNFVHLHNHTEYSLLDGAIKISALVQKAKEFGLPALAITDHGNLFGAIEFYKTCLNEGIKPIIGCEVYCAPNSRKEKKVNPEIPESNFHLTLLCQDFSGYKNLVKLVSFGYLEGFYYRPRVDKELLAEYSKGLICLSGCLKGEIPYYLAKGEEKKAERAAQELKDIFGENFFLEVIKAGVENEDKVIRGLLSLKEKFGLKICATGDCHYLNKDDKLAHEVMLCIQTNKKLKEKKRFSFTSEEVYFKSPMEMASLFSDLPSALTTSLEIAERCNLKLPVGERKFYLPLAEVPPGYQSDWDYLVQLAEEGLKRRYRKPTPAQEERLRYELSVIKKMGFASYFLIIKDIVDFARKEKIPVGPGRGSAVGSLCLYALGITDCDPLKYDLLFERFLNPERVSLPDIDIDFGDKRRDEVISYIQKKYGEDRVSKIITFGTLQSRAVVRDVGRVLSIPLSEVDLICKMIPFNTPLAKAIEENKELARRFAINEEYQRLKEIALKLEGLSRHASIHASGIVITPWPLWEMIPVYKTTDDERSTQYDMNALADLGIVKMDILGLKTLTVIEETVAKLAERGIKVEIDKIPFDDKKTYSLLSSGKTTGVFQLESYGMRETLKKVRPEKFEDLVAVISLYRPGPLSQGNIDDFIQRKNGKKEITYFHPLLEDVLKETYGMIVYQEQVMKIASVFAGFSLAQADILRQAMGKKIPTLMRSMEKDFINGAEAKGIKREQAKELFAAILPFSGYAFNKSHSVGYATISYETAYLLANYPKEFLSVFLTNEIGNNEKIAQWVREIREMGINFLPPDINRSFYEFTLEGEAIRFGLGAIKNIGKPLVESIVSARKEKEFTSLFDLIKRTKQFGNRKSYEYLIKAGALDTINPDRATLLEILDEELAKAQSEKWERESKQFSLFDTPQGEEKKKGKRYHSGDILHWEKEALGFYLTNHPLGMMPEKEFFNLPNISSLTDFCDRDCIFAGLLNGKRAKTNRRGERYWIGQMEDTTGFCDVILFDSSSEEMKRGLKVDSVVLVKGRPRQKETGEIIVRAEEIIPISDYPKWVARIVLELEKMEEGDLLEIKKVLEQYPGEKEVFLAYRSEEMRNQLRRLKSITVEPSLKLLSSLKNLPNVKKVRLDFLL